MSDVLVPIRYQAFSNVFQSLFYPAAIAIHTIHMSLLTK